MRAAVAVFCFAIIFAIVTFAMPARADVLLGEIEHSERLNPIELSLSPGKILDKSHLPNRIGAPNCWYRIPDWLAGSWHREQQTEYFRYNFQTDMSDNGVRTLIARSDGKWGTQKDVDGGIWQYDPVPYSETIDAGDTVIVQIIRVSEPIEATERRFVKKSLVTELRTDKMSGNIRSVATGEEISYFFPQSDVLIKKVTSSKVFDREGKALLLGRSYSYENRTAAFQEEHFYRGKDMRALFQQFRKNSAPISAGGSLR